MIRTLMKSKVHRATVTDANVDYMGSLTLDTDLMEAADLLVNEKIQVANLRTGARFETYVIEGEAGSGTVCVNGAAAHLVRPGDLVIIISYGQYGPEEWKGHRPRVVFVDGRNRILTEERAAAGQSG